MPSPFVAQQAGYLARRQSKQGVLLAQPYLMLRAACFREQGLERCCSRTAFTSASESRNAAFLPAIQERDQVTEGLAHGQHLNHPQGLLPGLGSHHALLGTAACPGSPGHPVQRSSRTHSCRAARDGGGGGGAGGFNPEPCVFLQSPGHLNFNCICRYSWGGEQGACLLQAAAASRLPASPWPSFGCRQGSRQEDFRAATVPQLLSLHPHVAAHEQLCEQSASGPAMSGGGDRCPLQHSRHRVRKPV